MRLAGKIASAYTLDYPKVLAYMWQSSDYNAKSFFGWWSRVQSFRGIANRGDLVATAGGKAARAVCVATAALYLLVSVSIFVHFYLVYFSAILGGIAFLIAYPMVVAALSVLPIKLLYIGIFLPKKRSHVSTAKAVFAAHPGTVIAVAGSYGKTSMKELLAAVLGSTKKMACTEGNKNTLLSQAMFAGTLSGDEDFVIVEFGEGASGDVAAMTAMVCPDYAVFTGLAPNHLDHYKGVDDLAHDFATLAESLKSDKVFLNADSDLLFEHLGKMGRNYTSTGFDGWVVEDMELGINYTNFSAQKCDEQLCINSGLIGEHNVGPMLFATVFASMLGISQKSTIQAMNKVVPYEHRMEPRAFHGGWLIDDTYNGNIDGMKAGLALLKELDCTGRKIYVTPGLVDQGEEVVAVHTRLGEYIAASAPNMIYLMQNSNTQTIRSSVEKNGYKGAIKIVDDPLRFYQNMDSIIANGDIILCQNDLPDYYN